MKTVTLIPGDGIGPEITKSVIKIFEAANVPIAFETVECGLPTYEKTGELIPAALNDSLNKNKVALKGPTTTPVGTGHRSINVTLRQEHDLYANVRPSISMIGIPSHYEKVDLIIVRENSEGLYRGIEYQVDLDTAHAIKLVTRQACARIGHYAFKLARHLGRKKVSAVHKANIMKLTDGLFLRTIAEVAKEYPDIKFDDYIVDNCCMQMVRNPEQFDVIVTENLYGDILSDLASGLVGGLGVASGANIGDDKAIFEAVHGSAPDIANKDLANPTALILSAVSMLEFLDLKDFASRIREATAKTLANPQTRTKDLGGTLGTSTFTEAVIKNLG